MPKPLPGSKEVDEGNTRLSVSGYYFSDAELTILQELLITWHDIYESGSRPFLTPISTYLFLPQLRAFWPLSSIDQNGDVYDISGQGRTLSYNGTGALTAVQRNYTPVVVLDSSKSQFLSRFGDHGFNFAGDFSFGLWVKPHSGCGDGLVMGKGGANATMNCTLSWGIMLEDAAAAYPIYRFYVSTNGLDRSYYATQQLTTEPTIGAWHLLVAVYDADGAPELYLDARPSSVLPRGYNLGTLYSSVEPLVIGHAHDPAEPYLDAEVALPFVCAGCLDADTIQHIYQATKDLLP